MTRLRHMTLAAIFLSCISLTSANAATYSFDGFVTQSLGPAASASDPDLPPIGAAGTVELTINDSNPMLPWITGFNVVQAFTASVDVPGYVSGSMLNNPDPSDFFALTNEYLAFGAYGPSSIVSPGDSTFLTFGRHSFRITFGTPLGSIPTTIGDIVAAIDMPGTTGFFSHELEGSDGFTVTRVEFPAGAVSEVPLPASAWLLIFAMAGLRMMSRRHPA